MKKIFFLAVVLITFFLTACSDDSSGSSATVAEKCQNGFSKACLEGTWIMPVLYTTGSAQTLSFSPPDILYLKVADADDSTTKEEFTMVYTSSTLSEDVCGTMYGEWWISGTNTIHFKSTVITSCEVDFEAAVTLTETELTFDRSYFHTATQIGIGLTEIESFIRQ